MYRRLCIKSHSKESPEKSIGEAHSEVLAAAPGYLDDRGRLSGCGSDEDILQVWIRDKWNVSDVGHRVSEDFQLNTS